MVRRFLVAHLGGNIKGPPTLFVGQFCNLGSSQESVSRIYSTPDHHHHHQNPQQTPIHCHHHYHSVSLPRSSVVKTDKLIKFGAHSTIRKTYTMKHQSQHSITCLVSLMALVSFVLISCSDTAEARYLPTRSDESELEVLRDLIKGVSRS